MRLLTRTTRSVAPTEAGERLLEALAPALDSIDSQLATLSDFRDKPAGTIRITLSKHAADTVMLPIIKELVPEYPDINVELSIDSGFADIVSNRFDAGVRLGEALAKDMIAVRVGPELRMVIVGSPAYFEGREKPRLPQDLADHNCINMRLNTSGGFYVWELEKDGREVKVRVEGQLAFNDTDMIVKAAEAGLGLGFVMEDHVAGALRDGRLVCVLEDWCPPFAGYHLYYPSRRQPSAAFSLFVERLRRRAALSA